MSDRLKIIHCADIHLDSAMTSHFDPETTRKRRDEILLTFEKMVQYAAREKVSAILIAGDLFDAPNTRELTRNAVLHCVTSNPSITFFYLKGNHDDNNFLSVLDRTGRLPGNLMLFDRKWGCYEYGDVAIYGAELSDGGGGFYEGLAPDADKINIVMLDDVSRNDVCDAMKSWYDEITDSDDHRITPLPNASPAQVADNLNSVTALLPDVIKKFKQKQKRKALSFSAIAAFVILLGALAGKNLYDKFYANYIYDDGQFNYVIHWEGVEITGVTNSSANVIELPDEIKGRPVIKVADSAI